MILHPVAEPALPFAELLHFACALPDVSGPLIVKHFRRAPTVSDKGGADGFDPVTLADRAAEKAIVKAIRKRFPGHGILGEEFGQRAGGRYQWVIDPIDGTRAFITGSPLWGTLIGLLDGGRPLLGVMDQPFTRERTWSAAKAAWMSRDASSPRRLKTRACTALSEAYLSSTHPDLFTGPEVDAFARLKRCARMTRYGGDCYGYCQLAMGGIDLVVEAGLKPYDIVALIPIMERAGGVVTTWDGGPATNGGRILAAGTRELHAAALKLLRV